MSMVDDVGKTILFVDDEKQILKALKRLFMKSRNKILLAEGGKEALKIMEQEQVDMMITDMRMPEMDGHQLLTEVKKRHPQVIRIALSGYTDKKVVLSALDKNLAKIYLFKPWNNEDISNTINNLFHFEALLKDKNLLDIINTLDNLPTIPRLYNEICQLTEQEKSIDEISKCIEEDQSIASRILRIANSAYYGAKTGSINDAVMFIGLESVKNIILTNAVFDRPSSNKAELERMWRHASKTNKILNQLYTNLLKKKLDKNEKSAGLLHNIGEAVLLTNISSLPQDIKDNLLSANVSHEQIGSYLLNWWELPLPIIESAMFHHQPDNEMIVNKTLVCSVHIAQHIAWHSLGIDVKEAISPEALITLGIELDDLNNFIESII